ncbi:MAG: PilZ domain-containing protein [Thermodesulfobacteriota bacterium]
MTANDKQKAPSAVKRPAATPMEKKKAATVVKGRSDAAADKQKAAVLAKRRAAAAKLKAAGAGKTGAMDGTAKQVEPGAAKARPVTAPSSPQTAPPVPVDKRQHPRKPFRLSVKVTRGQMSGVNTARDISLGGMFLETSEEMVPGQEVQLSIPFTNQNRHIKINGRVVRLTEDGVGVQFDIHSIDIE